MNTKQLKLILKLLFFTTILTSCAKKTNDANETFKYWSGSDASADMILLNGEYYESPHFTKEYTMYLKFKPAKEW